MWLIKAPDLIVGCRWKRRGKRKLASLKRLAGNYSNAVANFRDEIKGRSIDWS